MTKHVIIAKLFRNVGGSPQRAIRNLTQGMLRNYWLISLEKSPYHSAGLAFRKEKQVPLSSGPNQMDLR